LSAGTFRPHPGARRSRADLRPQPAGAHRGHGLPLRHRRGILPRRRLHPRHAAPARPRSLPRRGRRAPAQGGAGAVAVPGGGFHAPVRRFPGSAGGAGRAARRLGRDRAGAPPARLRRGHPPHRALVAPEQHGEGPLRGPDARAALRGPAHHGLRDARPRRGAPARGAGGPDEPALAVHAAAPGAVRRLAVLARARNGARRLPDERFRRDAPHRPARAVHRRGGLRAPRAGDDLRRRDPRRELPVVGRAAFGEVPHAGAARGDSCTSLDHTLAVAALWRCLVRLADRRPDLHGG
jgi:hypothetical protein